MYTRAFFFSAIMVPDSELHRDENIARLSQPLTLTQHPVRKIERFGNLFNRIYRWNTLTSDTKNRTLVSAGSLLSLWESTKVFVFFSLSILLQWTTHFIHSAFLNRAPESCERWINAEAGLLDHCCEGACVLEFDSSFWRNYSFLDNNLSILCLFKAVWINTFILTMDQMGF